MLFIIPITYIVYNWSNLPDRIPIHFGIDGEPNGWSGKWGILFLPLANIITYCVILLVPYIDPKRMDSEFYYENFYKFRLVIALFLCVLSFMPITAVQNSPIKIGQYLFLTLFGFFALLGNFIINIKPNWFIGIRTPWTLSNDMAWRKTHLVVGRTWFYGGLICAVSTFFMPAKSVGTLLLVFVLSSVVFAFAYSFWLYKTEERKVRN